MLKVYSQKDCVNCEMLKTFLDNNNIQYEELDVNEDFSARAFMLMNDLDSTPAAVKDNEIISGDIEDMKAKILGVVRV